VFNGASSGAGARVTEPRTVAERIGTTLVNAEAVVLIGSVAAGTHHDDSDIDLFAIGPGEDYTLSIEDGWLVSVSWRSADHIRATFDDPGAAALAVPAWRDAVILADTNGLAASLRADAVAWTWARCGNVDAWVASEVTGYAEEAVRLRGAIGRGDATLAAAMTAVLALHLAKIVAVSRRMLLRSENELWHTVAEVEGPTWAEAQRAALGLDGSDWEGRAKGALRLYGCAAAAIDATLGERQRAVVNRALHAT
jgi:Nucleotidyltransferase domain